MKATEAKHDVYDTRKLDAIYENILAAQQNGKDQFYEIVVDGFPVIGKNNDAARFMNYAEFITPETRCVTVFIFKANNQSDKYFFHLQPASLQQAQQLSGIGNVNQNPVNEQELTEKIRKEFKYEELLRENIALKKEAEENDALIIKMEAEIQLIKSNRDLKIQGIGDLILRGALSSDLAKSFLPDSLSGTINTPPNNEGKGTFSRKEAEDIEEENESRQEMSEREKGYLLFIDDIRARIGDVELCNVMHLLDLMAANPKSIQYAIRHVTNYLNQHSNEKI
ncbi:MAG: hypothetical protein Q8L81_05725 [Bacteroidota bacterium]|nr:hypothetical protein [Bacteroidota bacterium]